MRPTFCVGIEMSSARSGFSSRNKPLLKSSSIGLYLPFLDKDGLLTIGCCLQNAFISENKKYSILLSIKYHVTRLIVERTRFGYYAWRIAVGSELYSMLLHGFKRSQHDLKRVSKCLKYIR